MAPSDEALEAVPQLTVPPPVPADEAARAELPMASSEEVLEAVPRLAVPPPAFADEAAQSTPPPHGTPSDKAAKADPCDSWAA